MAEMIIKDKEDVHVVKPHPQIQFKISTAPPPSSSAAKKMESLGLISTDPNTSPGPSHIRPESRKRKPTCFLPNSQQDVMVPQRRSPSSNYRECCAPAVEAIKAKYGAIDKDRVLSKFMKERVLDDISYMLQLLNKKKIDEFDIGALELYYHMVIDAENVFKIDVKWLREHLEEIREAITSNKEAKSITFQRNECMKRVERNKEKLKRLKIQIEMSEKQMEEDLFKAKSLDKSINTLTAKFKHFQQTSLTEGLL